MDTTAFIRKINGEVSRMKPAQTPVPSALTQTTFTKRLKTDAGKSTKTERAKGSVPSIDRSVLKSD